MQYCTHCSVNHAEVEVSWGLCLIILAFLPPSHGHPTRDPALPKSGPTTVVSADRNGYALSAYAYCGTRSDVQWPTALSVAARRDQTGR